MKKLLHKCAYHIPIVFKHCYHPRMRVGNVFGRVCPCVRVSVCPSVCLCVCVSVCLSVQTITFEPLHIGTSFLVWRYILTISRSSLSIKVIGSRSRSCEKKWLFAYFNLFFLCMDLQAINEVKVTYQGKGYTSRSRSNQGQHQIEVIFKERYSYAGGLHLNQMRSCFLWQPW